MAAPENPLKILVPYTALITAAAITNTPASLGSIVATQELRCALDTDPWNATTWWSGGDQPIIFQYTAMVLPFTVTGGYSAGQGCSAFYCEVQNSVFTALSGNYNEYYFLASVDGVSYSALTFSSHGDGVNSGAVITCSGSVVDSQGNARRARTLMYYDTGLSAAQYQQLLFETAGGHTGANYALYDVMNGILINLPGELRDAKEYSREFYGSTVQHGPYGRLQWGGEKSGNSKRTISYTFGGLSQTHMTLLRNLVRYCRGSFPVLIVEDTASVETWYKAILRGLSWREPDAGDYWCDIIAEEC